MIVDAEPGEGSPWDEGLAPFAELVVALAGVEEQEDVGGTIVLDEILMTIAIEIDVRPAGGRLPRVGGWTPTQWTETTIMPAFHRLTLRIGRTADA